MSSNQQPISLLLCALGGEGGGILTDWLVEAARHADEAAQLARARFEAGVTDFQAVLQAEREVLSIREQLVQAQVGTAAALVAVYRAIGGGWSAGAATKRAEGSWIVVASEISRR